MPDSIGVLELPQNPVTDMTADAERRPVTSEVAGSSPVVPAIPFNHLETFPTRFFAVFGPVCSRGALNVSFWGGLWRRLSDHDTLKLLQAQVNH